MFQRRMLTPREGPACLRVLSLDRKKIKVVLMGKVGVTR